MGDPSAVLQGPSSEEYVPQCASPTLPRSVLPSWFIPAYQVELGQRLADGTFGSVYLGKWLGTDVAVKKIKADALGADNYAEFCHEADLWHPEPSKSAQVVRLGRPFFVCEVANIGTASMHLKGKPWREVWWSLYRAALGLEHLHYRGIIHGDLKGNNILIGGDKDKIDVKLADFGLSSFGNRAKEALGSHGAIGAFRWKPPNVYLVQHQVLLRTFTRSACAYWRLPQANTRGGQ